MYFLELLLFVLTIVDNNPYGEHDFGSFDWHNVKIFWKIDYYTGEYQYYCDPLSPECQRVMTVMLAEEY